MYSFPLTRDNTQNKPNPDFRHRNFGLCGNGFVEFFPEAAPLQSLRLTISKMPTGNRGEKKVSFKAEQEYSTPGIMFEGEYIQVTTATSRYIATQMCLVDGEILYVSIEA